jgi:hypothetical protein
VLADGWETSQATATGGSGGRYETSGRGTTLMPARAGSNVAGGGVARPAPADRITVALIPQAAEDLQHLQDRTGLSKTDIVNRAVSLYDFINTQLREGRDLLIRDNEAKETQVIRLM